MINKISKDKRHTALRFITRLFREKQLTLH